MLRAYLLTKCRELFVKHWQGGKGEGGQGRERAFPHRIVHVLFPAKKLSRFLMKTADPRRAAKPDARKPSPHYPPLSAVSLAARRCSTVVPPWPLSGQGHSGSWWCACSCPWSWWFPAPFSGRQHQIPCWRPPWSCGWRPARRGVTVTVISNFLGCLTFQQMVSQGWVCLDTFYALSCWNRSWIKIAV